MTLRTWPEGVSEWLKLKPTPQLSSNSLESAEIATDRRNEVNNLNQKYGKKWFSFSIYSNDDWHITVKYKNKGAFLMEPITRSTGKSYSISDSDEDPGVGSYITSVQENNLSKYLDQFEKTGNPKIDPLANVYTKISTIGQVGQEKFDELIKELASLTPEEKIKIWTKISMGMIGGKIVILWAKTLKSDQLKTLFVTLNPFALWVKIWKMSGKIDM